jgi:hypothetical protein
LGVELFDAELSRLCVSWLSDCVHTIREVAIANLKKLLGVFGAEWAQQRLLPEVLSARTDSSFLKRMTALLTARVLADALPIDVICSTLYARARATRENKADTRTRGGDRAAGRAPHARGASALAAAYLCSRAHEPCPRRAHARAHLARCVARSLPLVLELSRDAVPNIRFNAAKTLGSMAAILTAGGRAAVVSREVKPALNVLLADADNDVQFYAAQALETLAQ